LKFLQSLLSTLIVLAFIALCLGNQGSVFSRQNNTKNELYEKLDLFATVLSIIQNNYVDSVSSRDLIYGALEGTLASLDPHSQFLRPDTYKEIQIDTEGHFGGLGMEISVRDNALVIIAPIQGTPAFKAGLMPGDKIVRIDGEIVDTPDLNMAVKKFRGPIGSKVEVTVYRPSTKQYLTVEMTRDEIKIPSVLKVQILPDTKIGYIKITQFQENTSRDFLQAIQELETQKMTGLIVDLRNNPGGVLEESIVISGILVGGNKLIAYTQGRTPDQNIQKFSDAKTHSIQVPLVVLMNRGSASCSEILAGSVQDYKKGVIVGETSFGKGSVQSLILLKDDSALRLTTARYYTPKGRMIHGKGIDPDVAVALSSEDLLAYNKKLPLDPTEQERNDVYKDAQVMSAISVISGVNALDGTSK
jgi:carboxyl-terminal processing protease